MSPICIYSVLRIVFFQDKHSTTTQARVSECHSVSSRAASLKFLVRIKYKVWPVFFRYFDSSFSAYFHIFQCIEQSNDETSVFDRIVSFASKCVVPSFVTGSRTRSL